MKKLVTLLLAAGLVFSAAQPASAVDWKPFGSAEFSFEFPTNFGTFEPGVTNTFMSADDFTDNFGTTTYHPKHNRFVQRFILGVDIVASESLSAHFDVIAGFFTWGGPATSPSPLVPAVATGGTLGSRASNIVMRQAYLDWVIPNTQVKVRMGQQAWTIPAFATGTAQPFGNEFGSGIQVTAPLSKNVSINLGWLRAGSESRRGNAATAAAYTDDVADMFSLIVPVKLDGFNFTPWGTVALLGKNSAWAIAGSGVTIKTGPVLDAASAASVAAGNGPITPTASPTSTAYTVARGNSTAWWLGVGGELLAFDPFRFAFDFSYSNLAADHDYMDRGGWFLGASAEYKTRYGVPTIKAWYASGDDDDIMNGSERPLSMGGFSQSGALAYFAASANPIATYMEGGNAAGTWGVGLQWNRLSLMPKLFHNFRVTYIGGTNDKDMVIYANPRLAQGYLTTKDSAIEFDIDTVYSIYANLAAVLELNYIIADLDGKNWARNPGMTGIPAGGEAKFSDAWRVAVVFKYNF